MERLRGDLLSLAAVVVRTVAAALLGALLLSVQVSAQASAPDDLVGRVLSDDDGRPIPGASIEVLGTRWRTATNARGDFVLRLPAGAWRLEVVAIGHAADTVAVLVPEGGVVPVIHVRLAADPVALQGIEVATTRTTPLSAEVTRETVRQVPPLGEPDIFRAVTLLPLATQPNDLKGRIHLAGGASDETGVTLDGHPLQDPFHLLGLLGAFNTAALERATVRAGQLPASFGGRLSGVIQLDTRLPGRREGEAVLSLVSSGATVSLDHARIDALVSGRVTYLDRAARAIGVREIGYGFTDGLLRLGVDVTDSWRVEAIGFRTGDVFRESPLPGRPGRTLTWGEELVGARLVHEGTRWRAAARASRNSAWSFLPPDTEADEPRPWLDSRRDWNAAAIELGAIRRTWEVQVGGEVVERTNTQGWEASGLIDELLSPNTPTAYEGTEALRTRSAFGSATLEPLTGLVVGLGARGTHSAGRWHVAPRVSAQLRASGSLAVRAALERRFQFDAQSEEPAANSLSPPLFLIDHGRRVDVAALGATGEASLLGARARIGIEGFIKRYPDRPLLEERAWWIGRDQIDDFPTFRRVQGRAFGGALDFRLTKGDVLIQGSYAYQRAIEEYAPGEWTPTSWDAPHALTLFGSVPWSGFDLSLVYQAHTGRAITPLAARVLVVEPLHTHWRYVPGDRNSARVPDYHRIDLGARRQWPVGGGALTFAFQVLNLLGRDNPPDYDWQQYYFWMEQGYGHRTGRSGLPFLPSLGLEFRW